jgi:branched-chain amino acid transport system ATP-binding protein
MLELKSISVDIQNSPILRDLSMEVNSGELVCLVGRNGAGKTTTLKSIMGYLKPKLGSIRLEGEEIIGNKTFDIARKGVGFAPEESEVFGDLTVEENIEMSTWTIKTKLPEKDRIDLAYKIFPKLEGYRERSGNHLSGGERKMLSIARALTLDPKILI